MKFKVSIAVKIGLSKPTTQTQRYRIKCSSQFWRNMDSDKSYYPTITPESWQNQQSARLCSTWFLLHHVHWSLTPQVKFKNTSDRRSSLIFTSSRSMVQIWISTPRSKASSSHKVTLVSWTMWTTLAKPRLDLLRTSLFFIDWVTHSIMASTSTTRDQLYGRKCQASKITYSAASIAWTKRCQ